MTPLHAFAAYGIELEYMIVAKDSLAVRPIADELLRRAAGVETWPSEVDRGHFAWSNELVMHLVEIKNTAPDTRLDNIAAGFHAEVARINELLADFDARLMPGAMHPWMNPAVETRLWSHDNAIIYRSYNRIFDCHAHGWANIQSMHVNLPFADDAEFARLHAATRLLLPVLPALAASSPVADGRASSALDFRMACYRGHPARVPSLIGLTVPDNASSRASYEATVLEPMYRDIAPHDPTGALRHEWLNARGAMPRFDRNALELRVIDVQECPRADIAIAALTGAVTRALYEERWSSVEAQRGIATAKLSEILDACTESAEETAIGCPEYLALLGFPDRFATGAELWQYLLAECAADPLLAQVDRAPLDLILEHGPLARRILAALGPNFGHTRLYAVYRELCDCLADDRLFVGSML